MGALGACQRVLVAETPAAKCCVLHGQLDASQLIGLTGTHVLAQGSLFQNSQLNSAACPKMPWDLGRLLAAANKTNFAEPCTLGLANLEPSEFQFQVPEGAWARSSESQLKKAREKARNNRGFNSETSGGERQNSSG